MVMLTDLLQQATVAIRDIQATIKKAPPGSPPRPGLEWKEETHRWIRPEETASAEQPTGIEAESNDNIAERLEGSLLNLSEYGAITKVGLEELGRLEYALFDPKNQPSYVNPQENKAVNLYQKNSGINRKLRSGEELHPLEQEYVDELYESCDALGVGQLLWRGMDIRLEELQERNDNWKAGGVVPLDTFTSCSRDPNVAFNFAEKDGVFVEIAASKDAVGMTLDSEDTHYPEDETILAFGQEFFIDEIKEVLFAGDPPRGGNRHVIRGRVGIFNPSETSLEKSQPLEKASPGPPPKGDGWEWKEETKRWHKPNKDKKATQRQGRREGPLDEWINADEPLNYSILSEISLLNERQINPKRSPSYIRESDYNEELIAYLEDDFLGINRDLRKGIVPKEAEEIEMLMQPLGEEQLLYRGIPEFEHGNFEVGKLFPLDAFTSTSRRTSMAVQHSAPAMLGATVLEIHAGPNTMGLTLASDETPYDEAETLLDYAQDLFVDDVQEIDMLVDGEVYPIRFVKGRIGYDDPDMGPTQREKKKVSRADKFVMIGGYEFPKGETLDARYITNVTYSLHKNPKTMPSYLRESNYPEALRTYLSGDDERINDDLAAGRITSEVADIISVMTPLGGPQLLYWGVPDGYPTIPEVGSEIPLKTFTSTSLSPGPALETALVNNTDSVLFEIQADATVQGITLGEDDFSERARTLLDYGHTMVVERVQQVPVRKDSQVTTMSIVTVKLA